MDDYRLVFVGGTEPSGTALIERLLGGLPGFCAVGETVHLWRRGVLDGRPCGCGAPFADCPFWAEVGARAFGGWDGLDAHGILRLTRGVDRARYLPGLLGDPGEGALASRGERYTELCHRLYTAVARVSGARVVVDSSGHAPLAACLRLRYGARMRLLHVVRDPRSVAPPEGTECRPFPGAGKHTSPGRAAAGWVAQNASLDALAEAGTPTLRVRYEDFTADPDTVFARIAAFCGHPGDSPGVRSGAELPPCHTAPGVELRHVPEPVERATGPGAGAELPPWHRRLVAAVTAPVRARYGY